MHVPDLDVDTKTLFVSLKVVCKKLACPLFALLPFSMTTQTLMLEMFPNSRRLVSFLGNAAILKRNSWGRCRFEFSVIVTRSLGRVSFFRIVSVVADHFIRWEVVVSSSYIHEEKFLRTSLHGSFVSVMIRGCFISPCSSSSCRVILLEDAVERGLAGRW